MTSQKLTRGRGSCHFPSPCQFRASLLNGERKGNTRLEILMGIFVDFVKAFVVGGFICAIGQVLMDRTKLTPARILVLFVTSGVILTLIGIYQKLVDFGGAGATVPLTGFGYSLAKGAFQAVDEKGLVGAFSGGIKNTAAGISAAVFFGYLAAVAFTPRPHR